jgi:hypothetical protein
MSCRALRFFRLRPNKFSKRKKNGHLNGKVQDNNIIVEHHVPPKCYGLPGFIKRVPRWKEIAYHDFFKNEQGLSPKSLEEAEAILREWWTPDK